MKIACVGNMNNNFFSLMRYLRDLGVDAELLMFKNELSHFSPQNDTWYVEKWCPNIRQLPLLDGSLIGLYKTSSSSIRSLFSGYDYIIGNGSLPAYFNKANMNIDLFVPYGVGIEYVQQFQRHGVKDRIKHVLMKHHQLKGLQHNVRELISIDKYTINRAKNLKLPITNLGVPMVYNRESPPTELPEKVKTILKQFSCKHPIVFSHVSHYPQDSYQYSLKKNDVLIDGFATFVREGSYEDALLVLLEYGPNVPQVKHRIESLGLTSQVCWLPVMSRKEIMILLEYVDFGGGEFGGYLWGGTGWEFLSKGVPFFQYVNLSEEEFMKITSSPFPPFLNVQTGAEIATHLHRYMENPTPYKACGQHLTEWFDSYGGEKLASKYIQLLN